MFNVRIFGVDFFVDRTYDLMDLTGHLIKGLKIEVCLSNLFFLLNFWILWSIVDFSFILIMMILLTLQNHLVRLTIFLGLFFQWRIPEDYLYIFVCNAVN